MPLRFLGGPSRSEIINVLIKDSLLDTVFYDLITFQDLNGFTQGFLGTGANTVIEGVVDLNTGANVASSARLSFLLNIPRLPPLSLSIFSWNKNRIVRTAIKFMTNTDQTIYITSGGINPATEHFIGFKVVNDFILGCVGDGAAETLVAPAFGVHFNILDELLLEARLIAGISCSFFINNVAAGAITTGLPSGNGDSNRLIDCSVLSTGIGTLKEVSFDFWEFYQAR